VSTVQASVIIPAHDAAAVLERQLEALVAQSQPPPFEVVVVANRCNDATPAVAESFGDRLNLRVITADEQASAAYARNAGAAVAYGLFLLFCDADDRVGSTWVSGMVEPLEAGRADFVGGLIQVNREGLPAWIYEWRYAFLDQRCVFQHWGGLPYAVSASLAVTSEAFAAVGGFDQRFSGAGYEEVDLGSRLLRAGFRLGRASGASITYEPRRTAKGALSQARGYQRGGIILAAKEGTLGRCPSRWFAAKLIGKTAAHWIVRRREFHPLAVYARSQLVYSHWDEHRRWIEKHGDPPELLPKQFDFCVQLETPIIGGLAFATGRSEEASWYSEKGVETKSLAVVDRLLPEGGVFVDVGANIGVFTVAAAKRVGERGRVVAFEPSQQSRALLTVNLERHRVSQRVEVRTEAVGAARTTRTFRNYDNSLVSGFGVAPPQFWPGQLVEESAVEVTTLHEAIDDRVDMIKVDVEGFDVEVLTGAVELIERSPNAVLLLELNPASLTAAGHTPGELLELLPPGAWDLFLIDEDSDESADALVPLDRAGWTRSYDADRAWYANLLATRKEGSVSLDFRDNRRCRGS
jgi:FkbM family methyltransferase